MDTIPKPLDLTYLVPYDPKIGLSFSVDSAMNLPWKNFTHVQYCLSPPGSYYKVCCTKIFSMHFSLY